MKFLKTSTFCVLLALCFAGTATAQGLPPGEPNANRPKLFADLPDSIAINISELDPLLSQPLQQGVQFSLSPHFKFIGQIISKSDAANPQMRSTVIRSSNRLGAVFTLAKISVENNVQYTGRILSNKHGDAYELEAVGTGYYLIKKTYDDLHNE